MNTKPDNQHSFAYQLMANGLRILIFVAKGTPHAIGQGLTSVCDFLILLLPRIMRGSVLLVAASGAVTLAYAALRVMWWLVQALENWIA